MFFYRILVLFSLLLSLISNAVSAHFFVILLQSCHVFSGLRELSLLHAFSHIPVDKGSLGVHQVKLVVQPGPGLSNGGGVAQHTHSPLDLGQVSSRNHSGGLVVDAHLEASGTPVHKLNGALGLDGGDGRVDIFWHNVTTVQKTAGHILAMTGITFYHLIGWHETSIGDVRNRQLLMVGLLSGD